MSERTILHHGLAAAIAGLSRGLATCHRPEDRLVVRDYLAAMAPVLARAVLGEEILRDLEGIERRFGHTWLIDPAPFDEAMKQWRTFRVDYEKQALAGMTVNERLVALGLMEAFETARAANQKAGAALLLRRIHLDEESIAAILGDS